MVPDRTGEELVELMAERGLATLNDGNPHAMIEGKTETRQEDRHLMSPLRSWRSARGFSGR